MRKAEEATAWAVYRVTHLGKGPITDGQLAVCEQEEWDAMELAYPGRHTLVQGHMSNEGEAEKLARGTSGEANLRLRSRI